MTCVIGKLENLFDNVSMHDRKKGGQRKDHKNKKMHESVEMRHKLAEAREEKPDSDQKDIQSFKPGSAGDKNAPPH